MTHSELLAWRRRVAELVANMKRVGPYDVNAPLILELGEAVLFLLQTTLDQEETET